MTTIAATLTAQSAAAPATPSAWKRLLRRALETLGKHYAYGPYTL
jgi:hypothetical protein